MMQVHKDELQYQQAVLQHLGYYKGKIDGIWAPASISAKRQFEFKLEFSPAIPNNGLPFSVEDRLPKGLHFKRIDNRMVLSCLTLSDEDLNRMLGKTKEPVKEPMVSNDGPTIEAPVEPVAVAPVSVPVVAQVAPQQNNQHNQHKNNGNRR